MGLPRPDASTPVHDYLAQHRSQKVILNWPCLVGHRTTIVTQTVYRHQLRPVIETGATAMNSILNRQKNTGSV